MCRLSLVVVSGVCSLVAWLRLLIAVPSLIAGQGPRVYSLQELQFLSLIVLVMCDLSGPGIESTSLSLAGEFLSTGPLGKSQMGTLNCGMWDLVP